MIFFAQEFVGRKRGWTDSILKECVPHRHMHRERDRDIKKKPLTSPLHVLGTRSAMMSSTLGTSALRMSKTSFHMSCAIPFPSKSVMYVEGLEVGVQVSCYSSLLPNGN